MKPDPWAVEMWNLLVPVGTAVELTNDNGELEETRTRSPAWMMDCGNAVVKVEGRTGGFLLWRIVPKTIDGERVKRGRFPLAGGAGKVAFRPPLLSDRLTEPMSLDPEKSGWPGDVKARRVQDVKRIGTTETIEVRGQEVSRGLLLQVVQLHHEQTYSAFRHLVDTMRAVYARRTPSIKPTMNVTEEMLDLLKGLLVELDPHNSSARRKILEALTGAPTIRFPFDQSVPFPPTSVDELREALEAGMRVVEGPDGKPRAMGVDMATGKTLWDVPCSTCGGTVEILGSEGAKCLCGHVMRLDSCPRCGHTRAAEVCPKCDLEAPVMHGNAVVPNDPELAAAAKAALGAGPSEKLEGTTGWCRRGWTCAVCGIEVHHCETKCPDCDTGRGCG
jgi:hypothetical protein